MTAPQWPARRREHHSDRATPMADERQGRPASDPRPATRQLRPRPALATATRARSQTPGHAQGASQTLAGRVPQRGLHVFLYCPYRAHIVPN